ncbi:hypothetical protein Syun_018598 [Stephania yunnanensis]|uniref:PLATZ transcription factor family protein n=1 Tax=Stephania yunnanensis TaxID=152371 RepID=A0AAP0ISK7_9MAGN
MRSVVFVAIAAVVSNFLQGWDNATIAVRGRCRRLRRFCREYVEGKMSQVRRYVYHDVVRLDDLEKLIDCSYVQPYIINSAKVVFLKQKPHSRPCKGSANICLKCDRILQDPFHCCSLSCKVHEFKPSDQLH